MVETLREVTERYAQAVPKFHEGQIVWEQDYDINMDKMGDFRLCVVKKVEWSDKGWMVTVKFPGWPTEAVKEWDRQAKRFIKHCEGPKEESTAHEDSFRALTPPEYRAP